MKRIINGKLYDTDTAKELGVDSYGQGSRDFQHWSETLYQKRTGEFFIYGEGGPMTKYAVSCGQNQWSGGEKIIPLTYQAAQKWAEEHLDADEYQQIFGDVNEDGADVLISAKIPAAVDGKLRKMAAQNGISLTAQIIRLIENAKTKEETKVKKTVFVVYEGSCEIRTGHGAKLTDDEYAITNDPDPVVMGEFETKKEALEYLQKNQPEMWVGHECGQGILRFIPIHGMWVAEEIRTYDEDGDLVDTEYAGTWDISKLPEEPEE